MGTFIRDKLWLGAVEDAYNTTKLKAQDTTHILTVELTPLREDKRKDFIYHFVNAEDSDDEDLLNHFDACFEFIEAARAAENGGVLVHCFMGYSRSSTILLSYLMRKEGSTLKRALESVQKLRNIGPNSGFLQQLRLFEKMGNVIRPDHADYKAFSLEKLTAKVNELSFGRNKVKSFEDDPNVNGVVMERALASDPAMDSGAGIAIEDERRVLFRCRKCRRPLARDSSLLPHAPGRGKAFGTKSSILNRSFNGLKEDSGGKSDDADVCQEGFFFEPVEWMRNQILQLEGKLACPKETCSAKLGNFNWVGQPCPCGHWVVPAFHLAASKVDKCVVEGTSRRDTDNDEKADEPSDSSETQDASQQPKPLTTSQ